MLIKKIGLPSILPDNDMQYFSYLFRSIEETDKDATISIYKGIKSYIVDILPSESSTKQSIIDKLNSIHNRLLISIVYSKTIEYSGSINFSIE